MSFESSIFEFLKTDPDRIIGMLVQAIEKNGIETQHSLQFSVWNRQIELLKDAFRSLISRHFLPQAASNGTFAKIRKFSIIIDSTLDSRSF